jgi:hypothetical protein
MNSLSQLNTASDVTLSYTDLRDTVIAFDRATPITPSATFTTGGSSPAGIGINITNIINPGTVNAYYQIDVSPISRRLCTEVLSYSQHQCQSLISPETRARLPYGISNPGLRAQAHSLSN